MQHILSVDLHHHLAALGHEVGQMSVSVYDTAQVMRLAVSQPHRHYATLDWLIRQQQPDGGWNDMRMGVLQRTAPTMAALLAIHQHDHRRERLEVITAGLRWLQRSIAAWFAPLPDDLPVGVELVIPKLYEDSRRVNLTFPDGYCCIGLTALCQKRLGQIARLSPDQVGASTALHSWEAWGTDPTTVTPTAQTGVCASPAATAAWLAAAIAAGITDDRVASAQAYLDRARISTFEVPDHDAPALYPTAWPIGDFEIAYSLHTLVQAGIHQKKVYDQAVVDRLLDHLGHRLAHGGVGATTGFPIDGDDTAAAIGALAGWGRPTSITPLQPFLGEDHALSYPGELQPSAITTARAAQALQALGHTTTGMTSWLIGRKQADGLWAADKWNADRGYVAWQAFLALRHDPLALAEGRNTLLAYQNPDGGWGVERSAMESTAYAVLALHAVPELHNEETRQSLELGRRWLWRNYQPFQYAPERLWLAKDRYRPHRLARIGELCALLVTTEE